MLVAAFSAVFLICSPKEKLLLIRMPKTVVMHRLRLFGHRVSPFVSIQVFNNVSPFSDLLFCGSALMFYTDLSISLSS